MNAIKNNIKYFGKLTALVSFVYGTIILIAFLLFKNTYFESNIITIGLFYVGIAVIINTIMLIILCISAFYFWKHRATFFATCGILLLNIPIAFIYFFIVINLTIL